VTDAGASAPRSMSLANQLTLARIAMALGTFIGLTQPHPVWHLIAFGLFIAAVVTDWVDGYVARATQTTSAVGKVADPIADKILVLGTLIALTRMHLGIPLWGVFLILARELLMGGLRLLTAAHGKVPSAERWGKVKMGVQSGCVLAMLAILLVLERYPDSPNWLGKLPYPLTLVCVYFAWQSAYRYWRQSRAAIEKTW
jgi:CDP-diacylglycerol--glycerol-3-phosphate 3-phosphatidyltransferase